MKIWKPTKEEKINFKQCIKKEKGRWVFVCVQPHKSRWLFSFFVFFFLFFFYDEIGSQVRHTRTGTHRTRHSCSNWFLYYDLIFQGVKPKIIIVKQGGLQLVRDASSAFVCLCVCVCRVCVG